MSGESLKDLFAAALVAALAEVTSRPTMCQQVRPGETGVHQLPSALLMLWKQLISFMLLNEEQNHPFFLANQPLCPLKVRQTGDQQ